MTKKSSVLVKVFVAIFFVLMSCNEAGVATTLAASFPQGIESTDSIPSAPELPPEWVNIFAIVPRGATITAGMELGAGCRVLVADVPNDPDPNSTADGIFMIRTGASGQAYVNQDKAQRLVIACYDEEGKPKDVYGRVANADQDQKQGEGPTVWYLTGPDGAVFVWTPPWHPDGWDWIGFAAHLIEIVIDGDSGGFAVYVQPDIDMPTATPTLGAPPPPPTEVPTEISTQVPATATPTPFLTPDITPTWTATPWVPTLVPTEVPEDTSEETDLKPVPELAAFDSFVYMPGVSK